MKKNNQRFFKKYNPTNDKITFIEQLTKPME